MAKGSAPVVGRPRDAPLANGESGSGGIGVRLVFRPCRVTCGLVRPFGSACKGGGVCGAPPAAEAVGQAAGRGRVNSRQPMVLFPCRRCAEAPRHRGWLSSRRGRGDSARPRAGRCAGAQSPRLGGSASGGRDRSPGSRPGIPTGAPVRGLAAADRAGRAATGKAAAASAGGPGVRWRTTVTGPGRVRRRPSTPPGANGNPRVTAVGAECPKSG